MDTIKTITAAQASKELNIKPFQIRRYCNNGLIPGVKHTFGQRKTFTEEQMDWLRLAHFLYQAGFTTKNLRQYILLSREDTDTAKQQRLAMLKTHKRQVWQKLEDLQATIDFLERQEEIIETNS